MIWTKKTMVLGKKKSFLREPNNIETVRKAEREEIVGVKASSYPKRGITGQERAQKESLLKRGGF